MFQVGDRVQLARNFRGSAIDALFINFVKEYGGDVFGTVCKIHSEDWVGVSWDGFDRGHDCETFNKIASRSGWNIEPEYLEPEYLERAHEEDRVYSPLDLTKLL